MPAKSHMGNPDVGRSVVAGPLRESVRVGARLEQTGSLLLNAKASFPRRLRGRHGPPHCVCGCGLRRTGRLQFVLKDDRGRSTVCPGPGRGSGGDVPRTFG